LPAGATLTFVSGDTQQPAAAARVSVGNVAYTTDGAGQITLGQPAEMGAHVSVEAAGFLKRETLIRNSVDTVLTLWPLEDTFGVYTRTLVYGFVGPPLQRFAPSTRRVSIVPNQEFLTADPDGLEAHEYVAERMTAATAGQIEFVVEEHPSGDVVVSSDLLPDPCDTFSVACAERKRDGNYIVGGRIMISSLRTGGDRRNVILHEMGHIYGLLHSPSSAREDVMSVLPTAVLDFSSSELRTMRMMLQRLAGTVFPDDDTHVGASIASSPSTESIVCGP
jgi:hypothetical protein